MQSWLLAKLASKSDQTRNTDVGQTMLASFARPLVQVGSKRLKILKIGGLFFTLCSIQKVYITRKFLFLSYERTSKSRKIAINRFLISHIVAEL